MGQYQRSGQSRNQEQAAPKPFAYIPLPKRIDKKHPTGHDQYHADHISGQIHGMIEALSPIHIGSGIIDIGQDVELIKTAVRTGGNIVIPGSSLKGAIRSVVEAISGSCVSKVSYQVRRAVPRAFSECRQKNRLCVACRMFGAMGFQGNIAIQDAPHIEGEIGTEFVPELYAPGRYQRRIRDIPGRKFYMHGEVASGETPVEACKKGSKFRFVIEIDNLKRSEWGLLFTALGHHPNYSFKLKIGGAKPVCFGSIDFQIAEIQIAQQTRDRYLNWDVTADSTRTGEQLEVWKQECIDEAATDSLIQENLLTALAQILRYPNDRNCPSGLY
ncbi:hypothetical protein F4Z99_12310 [Candidatus Poribacteria bacterium]|nr:hypothetical protein [Candidatus Poribacteria bacterium]MYB01039.1 hypothetical protein [Candidatus Poribacteria bacterium]